MNLMRRAWLKFSSTSIAALGLGQIHHSAKAQSPSQIAHLTNEPLRAAISRFTKNQSIATGKVDLAIERLVENSNSVPVQVRVNSPMTLSDHVQSIMLFAEKNPQHEIGRFYFSPTNGKAEVTTRIRLATSQRLWAIAQMSDGSFWQQHQDVIVTLAACIDTDET